MFKLRLSPSVIGNQPRPVLWRLRIPQDCLYCRRAFCRDVRFCSRTDNDRRVKGSVELSASSLSCFIVNSSSAKNLTISSAEPLCECLCSVAESLVRSFEIASTRLDNEETILPRFFDLFFDSSRISFCALRFVRNLPLCVISPVPSPSSYPVQPGASLQVKLSTSVSSSTVSNFKA